MAEEKDKPTEVVVPLDVTITIERAKDTAEKLMAFAKTHKLAINIAGKEYLMVDAWQFAGTQLGLIAIPVTTEKVDTGINLDGADEIKYNSVVEVINATGAVVSRGFATCSSKETKKKGFEEYAIASMAQTRAIGKAYRNLLGWIVKMAGYETTPVDELDRDNMEADLARAKQTVMKALKAKKIDNSSDMMDKIREILEKDTIDTVDDANKVLNALKEEE